MPDAYVAYICGRLQQTKITRKASDAAEYIKLFGSFTRDRLTICDLTVTICGSEGNGRPCNGNLCHVYHFGHLQAD